MPPVFAHGRLRLYLLKLLDEAPRHGYEVIRLLEERFQGLYAPSAGTVYPRLAKLESEGLVSHATEGGRKVYTLTGAGRDELAGRQEELADLEREIRDSVAVLAAEIREDVRGSASELRREMRAAAERARTARTSGTGRTTDGEYGGGYGDDGPDGPGKAGAQDARRRAQEETRRAKERQAHRAAKESRRAEQGARRAGGQAREAQDFVVEEIQRLARRLQDQTQEHIRTGDWQRAVREGFAEITREVNRFSGGRPGGPEGSAPGRPGTGAEAAPGTGPRTGAATAPGTGPSGASPRTDAVSETAAPPEPEWARETPEPSADPARDLERLLDRFRDDIRDAARDHGVTEEQLKEARRHLSAAAARIGVILRPGP
ncbi:PadR family transcriptional regulator [Streptomyces albus]|uniref:PadR family transcriptional regulator n=1 Tax=Streptomyces albus TaxID=1888 RepID=UPI0004C92582|nr:PadR family transcriptional regulator [Streptomyces albus]